MPPLQKGRGNGQKDLGRSLRCHLATCQHAVPLEKLEEHS